MEAFGLDGDVTAIEITYVEPKTGTVQRKDVFCDPQQWEWRWQARFLISAELINLLSEAFGARHDRFRHYHGILTNCRLGYLCDLWRLRKGIEGIMATLKPEDLESEQLQLQSAQGRGEVGREVGPVHFFIPDHYLDGWTVEHLAMAVKACIEALRAEVERLAAKLQALGGGDWTQMLELILSKGVSLPDMGNLVMNTCTELAQRREVENHVTGGLADKLEALKPVVEEYELVLKDRAARHVEVKASLAEVSEAVQKLEEALHALQQWKAPEVVNKADPFLEKLRKARQDPAAQARRLAAEARRLLALWAQRLADAQQEAERLRMLLAEWIFKQVSCDQMELVRIENRTTSLETRATMLEEKAAAATRRANELQRKIQALAATMADDEQRIVGLRQELAAAPPPDPSAFKFARLRRELKNLQRREAEIEKETASRQIKLRAIRVELREIYKKLSWQCDLSDDDDDYNDKPYWERRKLATNGLTPFDERHFLYSEKNFHRRRLRKHEAKEKSVTQTTLLSQMEAKRYGKATGSSASPEPVERSLDSFLENTDSLGPFRSPGPGLSSEFAEDLLAASYSADGLREEPAEDPPSDPEDFSRSRASIRTRDIQLAFENRLRGCMYNFMDLLPLEGRLGDQRRRLDALLEQLNCLPADMSTVEAKAELLEDICTSLHLCAQDVASFEGHEHPLCGALQDSVEFEDVRQCLDELCFDVQSLPGSVQTSTVRPFEVTGVPSSQQRSLRSRRRILIADSPRSAAATMAASPPPKPPSPLPASLRPSKSSLQLLQREPARAEVANFGFRPNGAGEDSLENWSLFKVSKGSGGISSTTTAGTGSLRGSRSTSLLQEAGSSRLADSKAARFQKIAADCDFREYISQVQQSAQETWRKASPSPAPSPERGLEKKGGGSLSLPQLVSTPQKSPPLPGQLGRSAVGRRPVDAPLRTATRTWGH